MLFTKELLAALLDKGHGHAGGVILISNGSCLQAPLL